MKIGIEMHRSLNFKIYIIVAEVFAGGREVVAVEVGEEVAELEEEALAGEVAVGKHVELS